jgi:hypothetical protein
MVGKVDTPPRAALTQPLPRTSRASAYPARVARGARAANSIAPVLLKLLYWLAVLAISLALVVGLILWFESQDESSLEGSGPGHDAAALAAHEAGEGHHPLGGAVERVAGGQHQPVVADAS